MVRIHTINIDESDNTLLCESVDYRRDTCMGWHNWEMTHNNNPVSLLYSKGVSIVQHHNNSGILTIITITQLQEDKVYGTN